MSSTVNKGAWDWTRLKDDSPAVQSKAWSHLLQTHSRLFHFYYFSHFDASMAWQFVTLHE